MQVVPFAKAPPYDAPNHTGVKAVRLQGGGGSAAGFCTVGLSTYEPGGRAEMDAGAQPKIYVVLSGQIAITLANGERSILGPYDSCLIDAHESREVCNPSTTEALMLVVTPPTASPAR